MIGKYSHEEVNADDMKTEETASIIKEEDKEQVLKSESLTTNEQKPKRSEDKVTKKKPNRSPFNDNYMYSFSDIKNMTLKSKKLPTNSRISESRETPLNKEEKIENDFKETSLAPKRKYSQNERGIREPMAINTKTQSTDLRKSETIEKSNLEVSENAKLLNDLKEPSSIPKEESSHNIREIKEPMARITKTQSNDLRKSETMEKFNLEVSENAKLLNDLKETSSIPKEESSHNIREIKEPMARITKTQSNDLRKSETMEKSNLEVSENAKLLNDLKETSSIPKEESSQIIREIKEPMARITKTQSNDLRKSDTSNLNVSRNTNLQNGLLKTSSIPKRESTQSRRETEEPMTGLAKMQSTEMRKSETRELSNLKASEDVNLQNDGKETSLSTEKKHSENKKAAEEPVTRITPFGWVTDNINEERSSDSDIDAK
ncbi:protein CASP-like [Macrosteles quadrilineatus]|uniref:protein CASP-like n=1 Tax=Macrosteles quadrilineatus TaxID=74068 RepID=UPI0023E18379|nr:protein CASP-like [Macrosteles quadrilineatus]